MKKLAYVKKVVCNSGHEVSDLLVVEKVERQLLVVRKNLVSHAIFDSCADNMSIIGHEVIAVHLDKQHGEQNSDNYEYGSKRFAAAPIDNCVGNVTDKQR